MAPALLDLEVLEVLRGLTRGGKLRRHAAEVAVGDYRELALSRYPSTDLMARIWELRDNLTAYDAAYVALAEVLGIPLITCDARLASAPGHEATVEVFAPTGPARAPRR